MMLTRYWRKAQRLLSYRCPDCNYYYCECDCEELAKATTIIIYKGEKK